MSTTAQRLSSEATTIGDMEEYANLQIVVDTLCKRDFSAGPGGKESLWAKILRTKIKEIPIHIPSDRAVSQHTRTSFKSATEPLLLILQFIQCSDYTIDNLREATVEVTEFNGTMIRLLGEPAVAPKDTKDTKPIELSPQRESFYQSLWSRLSELFNSLIRHLQPCTDRHNKHRAMLHLTQHRFSAAEPDVRNNENDRRFCMLLASCPDQKTWQHTQWVFAEQGSLIDPQVNQIIENLCLHAQGVYCTGDCLAIEVTDSSFSDVSVTLLGQRPPLPSTAPTKSLLELSGDGVLKPGGIFSSKHKTVLACALSHALLCLHNDSAGPWLQAFWNLGNVFFLQESNGDLVYDIHHPYISCELAHVPAPSEVKKFLDHGRDYGFLFIQAFGKLLLELARGDEAKRLLGSRSVNIFNLKDLNDEVAPEAPGEAYPEVVRACLMFPKIWNEEQRQTPGVSAQDVIFRRIVEPLRKAVDSLGPEAWRPANLDLKAGAIRLGKLATPNESSRSIQELEHTIKERFQAGATDERIRIAVLDTGMDDGEYAKNENEELKKPPWKRVVARSNFCVPKEKDPNANTHDLDGHGTKVASIILRLAENVDLYIARVCRGADVEEADRNKETEFKDPEPAVVARAINWAVEQKVHVINLSLGYRDEQKHPGISDLRAALERAVKQQILVFAATSNEGLTADVAWPAKNLTYAIGIHSSTDNGRPSEFIGKASSEANLMVVGEKILSYGRRGELQFCSGTSFATPVAAAVGAMILAFVGQEACEEQVRNLESANRGWDWKGVLRTNRGMRNVLERISEAVSNEGGTYYRISQKLLWEEFHLQDGREHALNIIAGALRR
ncbi:peptidase S8/S53 domain-containing protein [Ilyonectria sp. MPI-CAGE-AT-0026]|nr:peptidase S8/S53 domain-containing protein [Ilyonectria sp. MPI-CAGE-AT-0026]